MKLFNKIAYHSTAQDNLKKFSKMTGKNKAYKGEGAMIHGWGLYLQEDKELNVEYYKSMYPETDVIITIDGKNYYGKRENYFTGYGKFDVQNFTWYDEKGKCLNEDKNTIETELFTMLVNRPVEFIKDYYTNLIHELNTDEDWLKESHRDRVLNKATKQLELLNAWNYEGLRNEKHSFGIQYEVEIPDDMNIINENDEIDFGFGVDDITFGLYQLFVEYFNAYEFPSERRRKEVWEACTKAPQPYKDLYTRLRILIEDNKLLTQKLIDIGIDGMSYDGDRDGDCYVIYNCSKLKIMGKE